MSQPSTRSSCAVKVGDREVGDGRPVFIIAEAGVNHNGSLERALQLVEVAQAAGADAVKFQLYRAEEQVSRVSPPAAYQVERTGASSMLEMAQSYDLPWDAHRDIARRCQEAGILYCASCFDRLAVDFLLSLGGAFVKIGSGEITNYPLLSYVAATGRPVLLSTGMSTLQEVAAAVEHMGANADCPLALLHCVSAYPASPGTANLRAMRSMAEAFAVPVGFSDHTLGSTVSVAAVALGASIIEKHFTLDCTLRGPDHAMSLDPEGLRDFVAAIRAAEAALGDGRKRPDPTEEATRIVARRSLVAARDIAEGERLDEANVTFKRPATGIDPRLWDAVRGRRTAREIPADAPITWELLA